MLRKLRTGFTTGACSAAAAKAAAQALLRQTHIPEIEITLPIGRRAKFKVEKCLFSPKEAYCSVIKDAGDDPDCTDGAEIVASVSWHNQPGILLEGGEGVGIVTKPGLGLRIGGPAINPVPQKNITDMVQEAAGHILKEVGLKVIISVPDGEKLAKKTLNPRLGIIGGLSILGTTGLVIPYSTSAYKMCISKNIDVALASGCDHLVLTTGGRSEKFAQRILNHLKEEAFIQMGDWVGFSLKECLKKGVKKVTICGMPGKISKIAQGKMYTHALSSQVDINFLIEIASSSGAPPKVIEEIRKAITARQVSEIAMEVRSFFDKLCLMACKQCKSYVDGGLMIEVIMVDFEGRILGRWEI